MRIRKKLTQIIFASFMVMAVFAMMLPTAHAELTQEWEAHFRPWGSGTGSFQSREIVASDMGNIYVAGMKGDIVALDSFGNELWYKHWDVGVTTTREITTDKEGNVYATGDFFNTPHGVEIITTAYDSLGKELWVASYFNEKRWNSVSAITTDDAGNVYVAGYTGTSYKDYLTVAYDSSGTQLWAATYSSGLRSNLDTANAIATDEAGNVYVTGSANGDYATIAYDHSGKKLWVAIYRGPGVYSNDSATAITTDDAGNVYVTGKSQGSSLGTDFATVAYNSSGNQIWANRYSSIGNSLWTYDAAQDISIKTIDNNDYVYVTGYARTNTNGYYSPRTPLTVTYNPRNGSQLSAIKYESSDFNFDFEYKTHAIDSKGNAYVTVRGVSTLGFTRNILTYDSSGQQISMDYPTPCSRGWSERSIKNDLAIDNEDNIYTVRVCGSQDWVWDSVLTKFSQKAPNNSPLADAGPDQTGECAGPSGTLVTLDGTGSSDPDGDTLTYTWSGPFGTESGATTTVDLPLGTHTIRLTVDDGMGGMATDNVQVRVEDTTPPVVTKAVLSGTDLLPELYLSDVLFEMEATDTCSGVADVRYVLDDKQAIVSGSYASTTINSGGDHVISYEALDNVGNVSVGGSLAFSLFEANASGLSSLTDLFLAQGLIDSQMETSLNTQAMAGAYGAFINHVEAQRDKKIDPVAAEVLIKATQSIIGN